MSLITLIVHKLVIVNEFSLNNNLKLLDLIKHDSFHNID